MGLYKKAVKFLLIVPTEGAKSLNIFFAHCAKVMAPDYEKAAV